MYAVSDCLHKIGYLLIDGNTRHASEMPSDVANELIRRSDSYKEENGSLVIDGGISFSLDDLERLVA